MPGSKCTGLHCVPESERKAGGRSGKDGHTRASNHVCSPATEDSQHCQHQACKQQKYRCYGYPKILNHVNYRAAPFPLHSCFIMKTEMNRDFRSSVLFGFFVCFFPVKPPPATVELNQEPWQRCCRCNRAAPHVAGDALTQGEQFTLTYAEMERCCSFN